MRRLWGTSVVALALLAPGVGCVDDDSDSSSATTALPPQPIEDIDTESDRALAIGLPDGYDIVAASPVGASGDGATTALRLVAATGRTDADPRLIEYTLYEFDDDEAAAQAVAMTPSAISIVEPIALEGGGSVGFVEADDGLGSRLGLGPHGPGLDAFFQTLVAPTVLAVGGSSVIQPDALAPLLESLSTGAEPFAQGLGEGMAVLIDETPLRGTMFEVRSSDATITVEWYPGASRSWFEYFSWGIATDAIEPELVDLGTDVHVRPPQSYGLGGVATDPLRTMVWGDERLLIVTHAATTPSAELAELLQFFLQLDQDGVATLTDAAPSDAAVGDEQEDVRSTPGPASTSEAPTVGEMARLQAFVETARGIEAGQPIVFEFTDDFPIDEVRGAQFLSRDLWLVAVALGLTEDGQTLEGANQARRDRIKGTPGTVELQASGSFTDVVVVHEMVHVIDPAPQVSSEPELLSLGQAVSEGNAHRIAFDFVTALPENEQAAVPDFPAIFAPDGDDRISTAVQDLLEFPYDEGRLFMAEIADRGGESLIETVLNRPPVSTEQLLFVEAWETEDAPVTVERPTAPDGAEPLSGGTLGVYLLYLTARQGGLGQEALGALDQWAGDSFVTYVAERQTCLDARILMDTNEAATELHVLLDQAGSVRSSVAADTVEVAFCA